MVRLHAGWPAAESDDSPAKKVTSRTVRQALGFLYWCRRQPAWAVDSASRPLASPVLIGAPRVTTTKSYALLACLVALLGACSSTPVAPPPAVASTPVAAPAPSARPAPAPAPVAVPRPAPSPNVAVSPLPAYLDPKSDIATARSVYFDFDDAVVKPEFSSLVERHGKYLMSNPALGIRIEGNTDDRGGAEYNLALGQKRAEAVRRALKVYGVKDAQMDTVSWGEGKPKAKGQDESAWSQNRRADLQYPTR